jgi:hypothetical protein
VKHHWVAASALLRLLIYLLPAVGVVAVPFRVAKQLLAVTVQPCPCMGSQVVLTERKPLLNVYFTKPPSPADWCPLQCILAVHQHLPDSAFADWLLPVPV